MSGSSRQGDAEPAALLAEEPVGDLEQDAGTVARVWLAAAGAAVQEVDQHQQALPDDRVGLATLDVHHEAHAAGVVLVRGVVQALRGNLVGERWRRLLLHAPSPL